MVITTLVLLFYVSLGGAHADIISDGIQGGMMVILAIVVILITGLGVGIDNGFVGLMSNLKEQDDLLVHAFNSESTLFSSWWSVIVIIFAHIPLGMLPHLGNKIWALRATSDRVRFIWMAAVFALTLSMMGLGGLLSRAYFGGDLLSELGIQIKLYHCCLLKFSHMACCFDRRWYSIGCNEYSRWFSYFILSNYR